MNVSRFSALFCCLLAVIGLVFLASGAGAETIYATGNDGTSLITIDTNTGAGTVIGTQSTGAFSAAFSPDGTLYTVTNARSDGSNSYLGTFNLLTGAVTTVGGPLNVGYMTSLEFAPDGTLYGGAFNGPGGDSSDESYFYSIDTTTGTPTYIGDLGFDAVMDFAFDSSGTLWVVNGGPVAASDLYTVDLATGASTYVSTISGTSSNGFVMGIMFDSNDTMYATEHLASSGTLYTVNPYTGTATLVNDTGINYLHGGDIYVVPEPVSSLLFIVGGIMLGIRQIRHRKKLS